MNNITAGISPDNINLSPVSFGYPSAKGAMNIGKVGTEGFGTTLDANVNGLRATVSEPMARVDQTSAVKDFVLSVDAKTKVAEGMKAAVLSGESNNLHQTMIASQEADVAFTLMLEMRNKVMETYQELMRLQF